MVMLPSEFALRSMRLQIFCSGEYYLYRMMISKQLDEIQRRCEIYGILGSKTVAFQKNVNYPAFAVKTLGI